MAVALPPRIQQRIETGKNDRRVYQGMFGTNGVYVRGPPESRTSAPHLAAGSFKPPMQTVKLQVKE